MIRNIVSAFVALGVLTCANQALAADFYAGKTIRIIVGTGSGGGYDGSARLTARFLGKYIPGNPSFTVENMPGASGLKATNYLFSAAPKDGTVIATINNAIPMYEAIGHDGIRFKSNQLIWLGSLLQTPGIIAVWHTAGVKNMEDAKQKMIVIGATGAAGGKATYPALLNNTIGTKFRIVTGYEGSNNIQLAMERGEVQGDGNARLSSWRSTKPDWVRDNKIIPIVQVGLKKDPDLPNVPLLTDLAQNDEQRKMFEFASQPVAMQQPFAAPPGVPADRVEQLRRGFDAMTKDPDFQREAERLDLDIDAVTGEEVQKIVQAIVSTPPDIIRNVQAATAVSETGQKAPGSKAE